MQLKFLRLITIIIFITVIIIITIMIIMIEFVNVDRKLLEELQIKIFLINNKSKRSSLHNDFQTAISSCNHPWASKFTTEVLQKKKGDQRG